MSLERWVASGTEGERTLILRHDVDQHPASALPMGKIEADLGLTSTWYFRWRTANPLVIERLREHGSTVGLHYETLTRRLLREPREVSAELVAECRRELREEIAAFRTRFGPFESVCPHGDSRVPGVNNGILLRDEDCAAYGVAFDGNEVMRGRQLGYWLTDRSSAEGRWRAGADPEALLAASVSPILCLTHPNNWVSGMSLWLDRTLSALLPNGPGRPVRTGTDKPPTAAGAPLAGASA